MALTGLKQYDQAEKLADQVLRIARNNPDALRLYAKFRVMRANQMSNEAAMLRQERCSTSRSEQDLGDRIRVTETTTCIPPSPADLQRAAQLDAQAAELRRRARAAMEAAIKATKGTVEGYLIQADLHLWDGDLDVAQADLQQAVKLDPKSLEAQDQLVQFYARTGQQDRADEQQAIARQLIHTTAAPLLRIAWRRIDKTAWQGTRTALTSAKQFDLTDARIFAYLGVVFQEDEKPVEAAAAFRTALVLEEGRLRLDEPADPTAKVARDALDFGLSIQARFHLAALLEQDGGVAEALSLYQGAVEYEPRLAPDWESREMFSALWPDQKPDRGAYAPAPVNAATLVADAHLRLGKLLAKAGKHDEAIRHFTAAAHFGPKRMAGIPMIGNEKGDTNFGGIAGAPASEAALYLAQALLAKGDSKGASEALYEIGRNIPEHLRGDLNELNMAIAKASSTMRQPNRYEERDPERRQYADFQRQQDQERLRLATKEMAPNARVTPELVGVWELTPDNKFLPWKKTLTVEPNADYTLVSKNDGTTTRGKMNVQVGRDVVRGRSEPSRGQMMLLDATSGQIGTMWYEFTDRDVMRITDLDGTTYEARRRQ